MFRKHEVESAIEVYSSNPYFFRPSDLYEMGNFVEEALSTMHVYLICRRPRITLKPGTIHFSIKKGTICGELEIHLRNCKQFFKFEVIFPLKSSIVGISEIDLRPDIAILHTIDHQQFPIRVFDILMHSEINLRPYTNLLVEYVGQGFGKNGERNALDRLIGEGKKGGHGALQRLLSELQTTWINEEIFIGFYSFEFSRIIFFAGASHTEYDEPKFTFDEAPNRMASIGDFEIDQELRNDLAEASLIRYFEPRLNTIYKTVFPMRSHKMLEKFYENDVTGLFISLSSVERFVDLYSEKIVPSDKHLIQFPITDEEGRATFLDLSYPNWKNLNPQDLI